MLAYYFQTLGAPVAIVLPVFTNKESGSAFAVSCQAVSHSEPGGRVTSPAFTYAVHVGLFCCLLAMYAAFIHSYWHEAV